MRPVFVSGVFDDIRSRQLRFLQEASARGPVTVFLWSDEAAAALTGKAPRFGLPERTYYLEAVRWVSRVETLDTGFSPDALPDPATAAAGGVGAAAADSASAARPVWAVTGAFGSPAEGPSAAKASFCASRGIEYLELGSADLSGFPYAPPPIDAPRKPGARGAPCEKRVVVTGCFDWLHTGHVRFFEEASAYGELTVVVGHDENIRLLKGEGHPLFSQAERQYVAGSICHVSRALVSSGSGWLDAEPEIVALKADRYIVNADGDKPEKREYCREHDIEYIVLERTPAAGLPRRASTDLRGF
jgi:cytidyltransferase-like protein